MQISSFIIFFLLGTMAGWIIDSGYRSLVDRKWTNAGYFIGPFCPIYGFGGIMLLFLVSIFNGYPFLVRCVIYFIAMTMVELIGGIFSTYILKVKLWDYSDAPFNLFGQVDLLHSLYWLILALAFEGMVWPIFTFINEFATIQAWVDNTVFTLFLIAFSGALARKMVKERRRVKPFIREGTPKVLWKHLDKINNEYESLLGKIDDGILIPSETRSRQFFEDHEFVLEEVHTSVEKLQKDVGKMRGRIPTSRLEKDLAHLNSELEERRNRFEELKLIKSQKRRNEEMKLFMKKLNKTNSEFLKRLERNSRMISWRTYVRRRGRSFHPFAFLDRFPEWQAGWKKRKEDISTLLRSENG